MQSEILLEEAARMGLHHGTRIKSPLFTYELLIVTAPEYDEEKNTIKSDCEDDSQKIHPNAPLWQNNQWVRVIEVYNPQGENENQ